MRGLGSAVIFPAFDILRGASEVIILGGARRARLGTESLTTRHGNDQPDVSVVNCDGA